MIRAHPLDLAAMPGEERLHGAHPHSPGHPDHAMRRAMVEGGIGIPNHGPAGVFRIDATSLVSIGHLVQRTEPVNCRGLVGIEGPGRPSVLPVDQRIGESPGKPLGISRHK